MREKLRSYGVSSCEFDDLIQYINDAIDELGITKDNIYQINTHFTAETIDVYSQYKAIIFYWEREENVK